MFIIMLDKWNETDFKIQSTIEMNVAILIASRYQLSRDV
jgi:hypothetical protein